MHRGKAFTIYELLAAIGVVLLLALALTPVFLRARRTAQRANCFENLDALGAAMSVYASNNDDTLPMADYPKATQTSRFAWHGSDGKSPRTWADLIYPYVSDKGIYQCPGDNVHLPGKGERLSYAVNEYFYRMPKGVSNLTVTGGSLSELEYAKSKILIAEVDSGANLLTVRPDMADGLQRHDGGANYGMADNHAEFHPMPDWWKTVPASTWEKPDDADKQKSAQWFPWVATPTMKW